MNENARINAINGRRVIKTLPPLCLPEIPMDKGATTGSKLYMQADCRQGIRFMLGVGWQSDRQTKHAKQKKKKED